jgi:hypothetical protein
MHMTRWIFGLLTGQNFVFAFGGKGSNSPAPPAPPQPIDPRIPIEAQARSLPSTYSPFGNAIYSGDPAAGTFRQDITLSPEEQAKYRSYNDVAMTQLERARGSLGEMPQRYEFKGAEDPTTNRLFMEQQKLLDRSFKRDEENLDQKLANSGLPQGSSAYDEQFQNFRDSKADAYNRAAAGALGQGYSMDLSQYQQQMSDIAQAMGMGQAQMPQAGGTPIDAASPYSTLAAQQQAAYNAQLGTYNNAYNADVSRSNAGLGAIATIGAGYFF